MKKTNKLLLLLIILIFSSSFGSKIKNKKQPLKKQIQVNSSKLIDESAQALMDIELSLLNKNSFSFNHYKDKIIIVDFWATWCPPCRAEIPHFNQLQKEHSDKVQIIGISLDQSSDMVKNFMKNNDISYPIAMMIEEFESIFGKIYSIPTTFILNKDLSIHKKVVGYKDYSFFLNEINKISQAKN